jgi:hypothetical protein
MITDKYWGQMIRYEFYVAICIVVIIQFSLGFNDKWANKQFEKIKDEQSAWAWLKVFKIPETKENFFKFARIVSSIVIVGMILSIMLLIVKNR